MARGGINKALVKDARDKVLLQGKNPSIDAIRIELGNTGSKTTIHRYIKELEEEEGTRLDDTALLSDTIRNTVATLADQLQNEARQIVSQSAEQHKIQTELFQKQLKEHREKIDALTKQLESNSKVLVTTEADLQAVKQRYQKESDKRIELEEKLNAQTARLQDKDAHIHSLEEKHQHARDALEHFRQSAKEQRDQEILRHEQQIQQLQAEQRQLNQTLSVKQDELTNLNKDNGRLVTQLKEVQKQHSVMLTANKSLESKLSQLEKANSKTVREKESLEQNQILIQEELTQLHTEKNALGNTNKNMEKELKQMSKDYRVKELELTKLKAEVHTQKKIFAQLKANTELA